MAADIAGARARATSLASVAGKWAGEKLQVGASTALDKLNAGLPAHEKFIQGQRDTLLDAKDDSQDKVTGVIAPGLRAAGQQGASAQQQALLAASTLVEAIRKTRDEAQPIQFLHSVAEWAKLIHSESWDDPTSNFTGILRIRITDNVKSKRPTIEEARFTDMDQDVLDRLMKTPVLSQRRLYDLPCPKVLHGPCLIYKRGGQPVDAGSVRFAPEWVNEWGRIHHNMERHNLVTDTMVAAALLFHEVEQMTLADLGTLKQDYGGGPFSD